MSKLKVAFFIDEWHPGGGTENQLQGLLSYLAPSHIDAHLFTLRTPLSKASDGLFPCPVDCFRIGNLISPSALWKLPGVVSRLKRGKFDVAMIYFVDSNLYFVPACHLAGIQAVVVNRRDMGYWYESGLLRKLNSVNRWATHFLVNAEAVKSQVILHEHFPPSRIEVIPNGVWGSDGKNSGWSGQSVKNLSSDLPTEGPAVGILASLREVKRFDRFLHMAALVLESVPNAKFFIAGKGPLFDSLQDQVRALGIDRAVYFLGQVRDVPSFLGQLNVGVLTSESEGLSNALIEYGLAGVPAVTFNVGGNAEIIQNGKTGFLVPPGDVRSMAKQVVRLLQDDNLCDAMGRRARKLCWEYYSPDRVGGLMLTYLESLSGSPYT